MKYLFFILLTAFLSVKAISQPGKESYLGIAFSNSQNAFPFGKFSGLFREILHPGMEISYGKIIQPRDKHEWFREFRLGWFYHRFVQLAIPLTIQYGYRYKFGAGMFAETALGVGYLHSVPAAQKFKLDENGNYQKNKGLGRVQATASFDLGLGYTLSQKAEKPVTIFVSYQQRLQFPFVKSYVPLLPYNTFLLGCRFPLSKNIHPSTSSQ